MHARNYYPNAPILTICGRLTLLNSGAIPPLFRRRSVLPQDNAPASFAAAASVQRWRQLQQEKAVGNAGRCGYNPSHQSLLTLVRPPPLSMTAMQPRAHSTRRSGGINRVLFCLTALLLLPLWLGNPLLAQGERGQGRGAPPPNNLLEPPAAAAQGTRISQREASDIAREHFPGRVLSVRLENRHWRVRMDQEGTVFNVLVDAETGAATRSQDQ